VRDDVSVDNEAVLMTDFINLKIKLTRFFRCAHRDRMCIHMHRGECAILAAGPRFARRLLV
jgi:hypothetical protein